MLLPTINPFYMQSTIWNVIIPNQNKKQCSAAFKSALHQVNDNQKKMGNIKHISPVSLKCLDSLNSVVRTTVARLRGQPLSPVQIMVLFSLARHLLL